ncbi:DUF7504 family protein [Haladaptatus sp. DFWS20]|uniref:DUF7504 family protein n=1 Tax=Haladaptatus sp. DFWS20 TaxID=3403467 RepID=UPI003EC11AEF
MGKEDSDGRPSTTGVTKVHESNAWQDGRMLGTTVVETVAEAAGVAPSDIQTCLYDIIEPDALDALFAPKENGEERANGTVSFSLHGHYVTVSADGIIEVESELARIKERGGNLLLTGLVPDSVIDTASTRLLGENGTNRTRFIALLDRNVETAMARLPATDTPGEGFVLDFAATARSAASQTPSAPIATDYSVTDVAGDHFDFLEAIERTLWDVVSERKGMNPGELRFCFDSLRPLLDEHDEDDVRQFLDCCFDTVSQFSGMGHYILSADRDSDVVSTVEPLFDATVELRVGESGPEQRWHLPNTKFTTDWFALGVE